MYIRASLTELFLQSLPSTMQQRCRTRLVFVFTNAFFLFLVHRLLFHFCSVSLSFCILKKDKVFFFSLGIQYCGTRSKKACFVDYGNTVEVSVLKTCVLISQDSGSQFMFPILEFMFSFIAVVGFCFFLNSKNAEQPNSLRENFWIRGTLHYTQQIRALCITLPRTIQY